MHRTPLPPDHRHDPFLARDAITASRARAADLDRSIRGVRIVRTAEPLGLHARCRMLAIRLRDDVVFSHITAALLHSAPLPWPLERSPRIHVTVAADQPSPHARSIVGHHAPLPPGDVVLVAGLPVTSAARTWCDLANLLDLGDLVAVGDHLIHHRAPVTSAAELATRLSRMSGRRGVRRARAALGLLHNRAESRPESLLRVILNLAGLHPEINHTLIDTESGRKVRPDFLFRGQKVILEYLGDYHRTRAQWRKDMTRRSRLEAQGWRIVELNADDLENPEELVARVRAFLARG